VRELRQANEILRKASVFARAELDRIRRDAWLRAHHILMPGEPISRTTRYRKRILFRA